MFKVPFLDLQRQHDPIRSELHAAARRVIDSGQYIGGEEVREFEREMACWLGVPEVCGVACATSGLFAILKSLGVGPGDEVITTVHTAIATAEAISLTGARVVFADIGGPGRYNVDPDDVGRRITGRTRAIIVVHLYGQPAEMEAFIELARKHQLKLIEDCAQAQGARYKERFVGTLADAAVFSFFPSKNLGGFGDGGAVVAREPALMKRIRMFSNHGRTQKYLHEFEGINSRLDALQAALLRVCLPHLGGWNARRREVAAWYRQDLNSVPGIFLPHEEPETEPVFHVFVVLVEDRDAFQNGLKQMGIETGVHYPHSLNVLPAYAHFGTGAGSYPRAEHACRHMLSLPMSPVLTRDEVRHVATAVGEILFRR